MSMKSRAFATAVATALATTALVTLPATAVPGCAAPAPGGEWRQYSHDLANTRNQPLEDQIGPAEASDLTMKWMFDVSQIPGGAGDINADPVVADGCVFVGTTAGYVAALNADTGSVVWDQHLGTLLGLDPGPTVSSTVAVQDGKVYVHGNQGSKSRLVILDESSGALVQDVPLLTSIPDADKFGTELLSSPKVFNGKVLSGISGAGAESGNTFGTTPLGQMTGFDVERTSRLHFRGIYTITDEATGTVSPHYTIPQADFEQGFSGGGVWSSGAIDTAAGYAYIGAGNPFSPHEHPNTNSILKVDIDPTRATYGEIVAHYHGTNDQYVDGVTYKPVCDNYVDVFTCETSDFDFGASPQLFDMGGTPMVGDTQKAGVYHAAKRDDMTGVWHATIGVPFGWLGGMGTASFTDGTVVAAGGTPGLLARMDGGSGAYQWIAPIADGIHFTSVTTAHGVAYAVDSRGLLDIWDIANGQQLAVHQLGLDRGQPPAPAFSTGHSVSVARHTVYVSINGSVIAYQP